MNPHLAADLSVLEELLTSLADFIRPLDVDCLNWAPPISDTNSIAAMVVHTVGSTDSWFARGLGESIQRDRDSEFHAHHTAEELIALIDAGRTSASRYLARLDQVDPGREISTRRLSRNIDITVSVAWCIEHALIHAGEHWGQIQLTKQFYDAQK